MGVGLAQPCAPLPGSPSPLRHVRKRSFDDTSFDCKKRAGQKAKIGMAPTKSARTPLPCRLIGYARVSTGDQGTDSQVDELRAAGCAVVLEEHASGADRSRPVLARLLREIQLGETLVVVRLDRLARSVRPPPARSSNPTPGAP